MNHHFFRIIFIIIIIVITCCHDCSMAATPDLLPALFFSTPTLHLLAVAAVIPVILQEALRAWRRLRPARAGRRFGKRISWHIRSLSPPSPCRNVTRFISMTWRQTTTARTWGRRFRRLGCFFARRPELCCGLWTRHALRVLLRVKGDATCVRACVRACTHASIRMSFIFLWLPQPYNMSRDYPTFSFLITAPLYHPLSPASPDVLLRKLAEALTDIFCSNPSQSLPKARPFFFFFFLIQVFIYWALQPTPLPPPQL